MDDNVGQAELPESAQELAIFPVPAHAGRIGPRAPDPVPGSSPFPFTQAAYSSRRQQPASAAPGFGPRRRNAPGEPMTYQHVKIPAGGEKITVNKDYSLNVPANADHSLHRRRRHGIRHHAGDDQGRRRGGREGLRRQAQDPLDGDLRRREVDQGLRAGRLAARRDARDPQGLRRLDQGPADHARRRRHPLAQRGAAPAARPVRVPATDPVLQGRAVAGQGAGEDRTW